ncbi:hypothetical protein LSAT2_012360 [Lamellibrachia satsuma]|nr:hypothetical protein LSAT2_012360 [Lamellibrachia satsuma]
MLDEVRKHYGLKKRLRTNKKACLERIKEIRKNKDTFIASMPDVVKYGPKSNSNSISDIEDTRTQDNATSAGKTSPSMTSTPKRSHSLTSTPRKRAPSLTSTPVKRKRRKAPTDTAVWVMSDGTRRNGDVSNRTNLEKNENEDDNSSTSTASEDIFAQPAPLVLGPQLRFRHSLAPDNVSVANTTTSSRVRSRWLPSEEELLFRGVVNFGTGQWVLIKKKYDFLGRTNVDLKDKWRNMKKNGRVEELREVFGQQ